MESLMSKPIFRHPSILTLVLFAFSLACNLSTPPSNVAATAANQGNPLAQTIPSTGMAVQPSPTSMPPTVTALPPADTAAPVPTETSTPTNTSIPPSATPTSMIVKVVLIAMGDNGVSGPAVGCGDSAVAVDMEVPYSLGVLRAAMEKLLSMHSDYYGGSGLYNALYQSHLAVADALLDAGNAVIHLTGTLTQGGECDSPRIDAQLRQTALQFSTVHSVSIFINGIPLGNILSLHG
jgi:hypothetical protein